MKVRIVTVLAVGLLMSISLSAHHGSAAFENGKTVTLKGTVKTWTYMNPHCLLTFDVKGDDGKTVEWVVETQAPGIMFPAGYRKDSFKFGDEVTVVANPVKNGLPIGRIVSVLTASGWTLGGIQDKAIPPKGQQ
jgi:hypothetical protein